MKALKLNKRYTLSGVILLIVLLAITVSGCVDYEPLQPAEQPSQPPEKKETQSFIRISIKSADRAILAVYERLLNLAKSDEAKKYLADFYTKCDNWSADKEMLSDGRNIWHIMVDMTEVEDWQEKAYWQKASWLILKDDEVIPSNRFEANALRIEADLQSLSLSEESATEQ